MLDTRGGDGLRRVPPECLRRRGHPLRTDPRGRHGRAPRLQHGLGGGPDHHPVEDRDRLRLQLVGLVHRPAGQAVSGVDDRARVPRRRDRDGQARGQRARHDLPRPDPLGEGRGDDRLALGGSLHPRRRDRVDARGVRRARPGRDLRHRAAGRRRSSCASPATCSPRSTAASTATTTATTTSPSTPRPTSRRSRSGAAARAAARSGAPASTATPGSPTSPASRPRSCASRYDNVRALRRGGRTRRRRVSLNCCLSVEVTDAPGRAGARPAARHA